MIEDRTINIKELVKYILLRWRGLLIWMVAFAVLTGVYACFASYKEASANKNQNENINYDQYENNLSEKQIENVKNAVGDYETYEKTYLDYKEYIDNSIKMQINANSVSTQKMIYRISGNDDVLNIKNAYEEMIADEEACKEIIQTLDWNIDVSYVRELISVSDNYNQGTLNDGQIISEVIENNVSTPNAVLLSIKIIADTEEHCTKIGDIVDKEINEIGVNLQEKFGEFSIQKIDDRYYQEANTDLLNDQQNCINEMNVTKGLLNGVRGTLLEEEQAYFDALIETVDEENVASNESYLESEDVKIQYINVKYIALGACIGLVLFCLYTILVYLSSSRLVSKGYITNDLKDSLLGVFYGESDKKKNIVDKFVNKIFDSENVFLKDEEKYRLISTEIKAAYQKDNLKKIYITGTVESKETNIVLKQMIEELEKQNIEMLYGSSILCNADSLENFTQSDGVIFIEQMNKSLIKEINLEIEECKKHGVKNLGFVLINTK